MLILLLACSSPAPSSPAPAQPPAATSPAAPPTVTATPATGFDCVGWAREHQMVAEICSESPHLPGLWLLQSQNGGDTRYIATRDGKPLKGGGAAVAAFLRSNAAWDHPLTTSDIAGVLSAFGSYPPGFTNGSAATFTQPFTYQLTTPFSDWQGHGGPNSVAGATPTGAYLRATLTGSATAPIQWVVESGSGSTWSPVATVQWDRGPAK